MRRRWGHATRRVAIALAAFGAVVLSCASPTQVELVFSTDVPCANVRGLAVTVGQDESADERAPASRWVPVNCHAGMLGTMFVQPGGDKDGSLFVRSMLAVGIDLDACVAEPSRAGCIVARRALSFVRRETLRVPVPLTTACDGVSCARSATCALGSCVSAAIDAESCARGDCVLRDAPMSDGSAPEAGAPHPESDAQSSADAAVDVIVPSTALCDLPTGTARCDAAHPYCCRTVRGGAVVSAICVADRTCPDPGDGGVTQNLLCSAQSDCAPSRYCCKGTTGSPTASLGTCCTDRRSPRYCRPDGSAEDCFPFQCLPSRELVSTCDGP